MAEKKNAYREGLQYKTVFETEMQLATAGKKRGPRFSELTPKDQKFVDSFRKKDTSKKTKKK